MDKELAQLHDLTRNMLVEVQKKLIAKQVVPGFSPSDLKKVRKALSNLDFDTESYGDIMEQNVSNPKGLMKAIRNQENRVMKAFELLPDDTIHHLIQQRTGGDFGLEVSGDTVRNAVTRLQDRFQMRFGQATGPSGVVRGDTALSNFAHKADDRATGLEKLSGIGKNTDPSTTSHRFGTAGYSKNLSTAEMADADSLVEALSSRIAPQLEDVKVGIETDSPRVQAIRNLDPRLKDAYKATNTAEDISGMRSVLKNIPEQQLIQTYQNLVPQFSKGAMRLVPGIGKIGVGLTALGALGDAASATTGTYGAVTKTGKERTASGINAASGVLGLASLVAPPLTAASVATGVVGMLAENRIERDKRKERDTDIKAGRIQPKRPDPYTTSITKREPSTLEKITSDPLNELQYAGKQVMSFFGGALRMASPLGL